jgi:hypothetical protein
MRFELVQNSDKVGFEDEVNQKLGEGFVFAGNVVHSTEGWAMPMILIADEDLDRKDTNMETRLAKQLWGMFIARLF